MSLDYSVIRGLYIRLVTIRFCAIFVYLQVPELASLGRVFRSTAPVELTESETEYVVRCVKHVLDRHVILDFTISNTIEEQVKCLPVTEKSICIVVIVQNPVVIL